MADTSTYPATLDGDLRALVVPGSAPSGFEDFAQLLADAVAKIETELGTNPSGAAASVAAAIASLAPLASPAFTGTPTAPTAAGGTSSTQLATTAFVAAALAALVDSSPAALDTLNELAAALGDDPNFATTVTTALAAKADTTALAAHEADTTNIHGIADTAALLTEAEAAATYVPLAGDPGSVHWASSDAGGTGLDLGDTDSTSRLELESYQALAVGGFGEVIRIYGMAPDSYQHITWYFAEDPSLPPDDVTNPLTQGVWMGAHYGAEDPLADPHGHWSVEVPGSDGQLRSRFEVLWCNPTTFAPGVDKTNVRVAHGDLTLTAFAQDDTSGRAPVIRLAGASNEKAIEWNVGTGGDEPATRRWHLLCDVTAESGSDAGSDFALRRYNDAGDTASTAMYVKRSTGNVTFGEASAQGAKVSAISSGDNHGVYVRPSTIGAAFAAFAADLPAVGDRAIQLRVQGDVGGRFVMFPNGKLEWGDGSGTRDVNLYRSSADFLATDDAFVPARIFLNATSNAYLSMAEQASDPLAPAANVVRLYAKDNGAGKTQLVARFNTGAVQVVATEP